MWIPDKCGVYVVKSSDGEARLEIRQVITKYTGTVVFNDSSGELARTEVVADNVPGVVKKTIEWMVLTMKRPAVEFVPLTN